MAAATMTPISNNNSSISQVQQANNMYRVGDYVFFENSASSPFAIRRIEELNRTANGNVEARVMCFYRRAEVPTNVLAQADKHHWGSDATTGGENNTPAVDPNDSDDDENSNGDKDTDDKSEKGQMRQREVFLSRYLNKNNLHRRLMAVEFLL
jgi:metastasis-associated protein MTA